MVELTVTSPVLTNIEAAEWLRITDDYEQPEDAIRALYRLVRQDKLRPLRVGKTYKFTLDELQRYVADETSAFEPTKRRASDQQTVGKPAPR